jgi:hypothetical protein
VLTDADVIEIQSVAERRWPGELFAGDAAVWSEWRRSLERIASTYDDVMTALMLLGETHPRFPALSTLLDAVRDARDERVAKAVPRLPAPVRRPDVDPPGQDSKWDTLAERYREGERIVARHEASDIPLDPSRYAEELRSDIVAAIVRRHYTPQPAREVGPVETKARELLAAGGDPGELAIRFMRAFTTNRGQSSAHQPRRTSSPPTAQGEHRAQP